MGKQADGAKYGMELAKWWSKAVHEKGRVTRHLSPFEQKPVASLFRTMPQKGMRKIKENWFMMGTTFSLVVGTIYWGEYEADRYHRTHWS